MENVVTFVARPLEKSQEELSQEIWTHRPLMLSIARRMLHAYPDGYGLAEDLVQDAMLKSYRKLHLFRRDCKLSSWLAGITRNRVIDFIRCTKYQILHTSSLEAMAEVNGEIPALAVNDDHEERYAFDQSFKTALARLPERYAQLINLRYGQDLSHEEIQGRLQVPIGTVKSNLHRAVQLLKHEITQLRTGGGNAKRSDLGLRIS